MICRAASVEATTQLKCLVLARERFVDILGPLYSLMQREKSPAVVTQRLMRLQTKVKRPVSLMGGAQLLSLLMSAGKPAILPVVMQLHSLTCPY